MCCVFVCVCEQLVLFDQSALYIPLHYDACACCMQGPCKWWRGELTGPPSPDKWQTLQHNGPVFAPPYEAHGVKLLYEGEEVDLTPEQEVRA